MDEAATIEELNQARRQAAAENTADAPEAEKTKISPLVVKMLAGAKDGLDWVLDFILIGEIPFIGQIPGIIFALFLAYYLKQGGWFEGRKLRIILLALGFTLDNLPLINNLPLTFLSVLL